MELNVDRNSVFVFDLDDTLYQEYSFLESSFRNISSYYVDFDSRIFEKMLDQYAQQKDVFGFLLNSWPDVFSSKTDLIQLYRNHIPEIELFPGVSNILDKIKAINCSIGLLTDGRSITQRNKIKALGLESVFDKVIVSEEFGSEKPTEKNYLVFYELNPNGKFFYFGDNLSKDFITPNGLGWDTICILDNGKNIHTQDFSLPNPYLPRHCIESYFDISLIVD
jgi:putative hydrolase of the HAD superfamily